MRKRGGSMMMEQRTASCEHRERFDRVTDAYRCLVTGARPSHSAAELAAVISSGLSGLGPHSGRQCCNVDSVELICISVTLVEKIASSLTSQIPPTVVSARCVEILGLLFQDLDLMQQLVQHFQAEDQIISHLAAKTVTTCVFYHLLKSGLVSPVWQQRCVQAFHSSSPGTELDACLWSLTEILKRLLRGAHPDLLRNLVAAFDSSLTVLCSKFLHEERGELTQGSPTSSSRRWGTTLCLVLDLLEVLTASCSMFGAGGGVCLNSQRITHIHAPALLSIISRSSQAFVRKRALLLLKRAMLQKAGEDWALGEVPSPGPDHEHLSSDMKTLAESVLAAVDANWLQRVVVEPASSFGGSRSVRGAQGQTADCVMLRAVSLLLLKSTELHSAGGTGVDSALQVYGLLQSLWSFLRAHNGRLSSVSHLCSWVSLLFGEQDDDMMEAAKALLSIFLHHRQCSGLSGGAVLEAACSSGCNPHCHFLLLLRSVSLDHTILLDFLISTETCFLEYFVRYLKYLRADWQGFTAAAGGISHASDRRLSPRPSQNASGDVFKVRCKGERDPAEWSACARPTAVISTEEVTVLAAGLRLVEYGSSDDSDPENMEVSQGEPGKSVSSASENSSPPATIPEKQYQVSNVSRAPESRLARSPEGSSLPGLRSGQTLCPNGNTQSGRVTLEPWARAVLCLSELSALVTRLHTKKLFPYNPASLLRLLEQVEKCSQQSHPFTF